MSTSESIDPKFETAPASKRTPLWMSTLLWMLAFLMAAAAMIYQRQTGPTYPARGTFEIAGTSYDYKLIRTHETTDDAAVQIPSPGPDVQARLFFKRFRTDDEFQPMEMLGTGTESSQSVLEARLPKQPAAGKLEYYVQLETPEGTMRLPTGGENVIIRFKDPVPNAVLFPHVTMMILTILIGIRAGLSALFAPRQMRLYSWLALAGMTLGGMILGPIVQKYAFGEYWTGFPFGGDWTDNKMLFMWLAWVVACTAVGFHARRNEWPGRLIVLAATLVMTIVYMIPHSMGGSELDYSQIDQGVDPREAIETGRQ